MSRAEGGPVVAYDHLGRGWICDQRQGGGADDVVILVCRYDDAEVAFAVHRDWRQMAPADLALLVQDAERQLSRADPALADSLEPENPDLRVQGGGESPSAGSGEAQAK